MIAIIVWALLVVGASASLSSDCAHAQERTGTLSGIAQDAHKAYLEWKNAKNLEERYKALMSKLTGLRTQMADILADLRSGRFCNACNRSATQLRQEGENDVEGHFARNGGTHPADPALIAKTEAEWNAKIAQVTRDIQSLGYDGKDLFSLHFAAKSAHELYESRVHEIHGDWVRCWHKYRDNAGGALVQSTRLVANPPKGKTRAQALAAARGDLRDLQEGWSAYWRGLRYLGGFNTKIRSLGGQVKQERSELGLSNAAFLDLSDGSLAEFIVGYEDDPGEMPTAHSVLDGYGYSSIAQEIGGNATPKSEGGVSPQLLDAFD